MGGTVTHSTSLAAYHSLDLPDLENAVLEMIDSFGASGCCTFELMAAYPSHAIETITPRFAQLEKKGLIFRAGDTRVNPVTNKSQKIMRSLRFDDPLTGKPYVKPAEPPPDDPYLEGALDVVRTILDVDPSFKGSPAAKKVGAMIRMHKGLKEARA